MKCQNSIINLALFAIIILLTAIDKALVMKPKGIGFYLLLTIGIITIKARP